MSFAYCNETSLDRFH